MKIITAWAHDPKRPEEMPWLLSAYDEYTQDSFGGTPDFYTDEVAKNGKGYEVRECVISLPDSEIEVLFAAHIIRGSVS